VNARRRRVLAALSVAVALACGGTLAGCDTGQGPLTGIGEPLQVANAQFIPGALPGSPPLPEDAATPTTADGGTLPLSVLSLNYSSQMAYAGESSKSISGDVSSDTQAVGIRFADMGSGYWVVPVGTQDLQLPNANTFGLTTSYALTDPAGLHDLLLVAIGPTGAAGIQTPLQICLGSRIPDNGHACDPTIAPPAAVMTLQWDAPFDLDLHVITSSGLTYDPKTPYGEDLDAAVRTLPTDVPFIDRDSDRNCIADGLNQEDLIFPDSLPNGVYDVFVDPFAACGQNSVRFTFTIYQRQGTCPACSLQPTLTKTGEFLASQVTGGTQPPLFVDELQVQ
jgi:hypothetical protein